jgi:hypothetical protein
MQWIRMVGAGGLLILVVAVISVNPAAVRAAMPGDQQEKLWQRTCEKVADGLVSPQEALVCTHEGLPQWSDRVLRTVERVCEKPLDGTYEYRSEFPTELAACFVE